MDVSPAEEDHSFLAQVHPIFRSPVDDSHQLGVLIVQLEGSSCILFDLGISFSLLPGCVRLAECDRRVKLILVEMRLLNRSMIVFRPLVAEHLPEHMDGLLLGEVLPVLQIPE